jgi:parallel beta-helix repeat protein
MWTYRTLAVSPLFALALTGSVWGQVDINQSKALAGNVTPGDAPGFPVTISRGGSYKLTGNLIVPDANTTALRITASYVTLDLNGFFIAGRTSCTGFPVKCTPTGTGSGVDATGRRGVVVRNGQIFGMGHDGILVGPNSLVDHVLVQSNGGNGIETAGYSTVSTNIANFNGDEGISGNNCTVTNNTANGNGDIGLFVTDSTASNNTASGNGGTGIDANGGMATNNTANGNGLNGIEALGGTATNNTADGNSASGIVADTATNNAANRNGTYGLAFSGAGGGYANNVLNDNNGGNTHSQVLGGIEMGTNICGGDTLCP